MDESAPRILVDALAVTSGGGHAYAVNLIRELDRDDRGLRFTFLVPPGPLGEIATDRVALERVALPNANRWLRLGVRLAYEELVLPIRARHYDALYAIADIVSPLQIVPTVVALRNLNIYDHRYDDTLRLRILEGLVRLGLRSASRLVFPSRAAADLIGERLRLPESRRRVVSHGVDGTVFARISESEGGSPYVFLPAAVERHKNLDVLLEAIPHFSDSALEVRVAGSTETEPHYRDELLRRARELGVEHRFHLLGPVPYERIVRYYRGAVALVFPSHLETFGHPMLEAMLTGTPIVASSIPAFRELGEGVALFFPPDDPVELSRAIDRLASDPNATRARVEKGRERAASYSWRRSADSLCAVLREVIGWQGASEAAAGFRRDE
jgi:glycosyltransferase involved in cell wall biosynthesis